jgi:transaldolase/glucose-6-phosphate isomerase
MTIIGELAEQGQAVWLDYIRRSLVTSGELQKLVDQGLRGVTSNPTIFDKVIAGSTDYDEDLKRLVDEGRSVEEIYEELVFEDIRRTADVLRPVYDATSGTDGYVSLEISPALAYDTDRTISEARDLFGRLNRANVMIKVPATEAGIPAIEVLIGEAININVTLIFSLDQYEKVVESYIRGLQRLYESGGDISRVASVASFFISRVDTAVDAELEKIGETNFQGAIAVANAKIAYARFKEIFAGERWQTIAAHGGKVQRVLWASTGTKNPRYSDVLYVEELIGPDTVNTMPPAVLQAFLDHGHIASTLDTGLNEASGHLNHLAGLGIDLDGILQKLQEDGVGAFQQSFDDLMDSIAEKRKNLIDRWQDISCALKSYQDAIDRGLTELRNNNIMARIWAHDYTVWKPEPEEITNRLGWLHSADGMSDTIQQLKAFTDEVRSDGYTQALLLGMGGSSLAPEVFSKTFGTQDGYLDLAVLDSTDPAVVQSHAERLDPHRSLFIVSTKSGTTVETLSFFKFFYNWVVDTVGKEKAGEHFVAITDPGSFLADLADRHEFRATFLNDPNIGGRYSALSCFGLVPAALIGMDVKLLLDRAMIMTCNCASANCPVTGNNDGARLGVVLGEMALTGRDKMTIVTSPEIHSFGNWVEQLLAESTGKEGKGILPVVGESLGSSENYGNDRLFIHLCLAGDTEHKDKLTDLRRAGYPVVTVNLHDKYDLGRQFFLWEMATAVAGYRMGINPFDQPDVESAKVLARRMVDEYKETGGLPEEAPTLIDGNIMVFSGPASSDSGTALASFVRQGIADGAYIALQAYIQTEPETDKALHTIRTRLRDQFKVATTVGYGPRFLHSTGQLHKGDGGKGLFVQFTADSMNDKDIPDDTSSSVSSMSFGVLKMAQAMGDRKALLNAGRKVIRFHLGNDIIGGLTRLGAALV